MLPEHTAITSYDPENSSTTLCDAATSLLILEGSPGLVQFQQMC